MSLTRPKTILVTAPRDDAHSERVLAELNVNFPVRAHRISLAEFPSSARATIELSEGHHRTYQSDGETIDLDTVISVWWRRPERCELPPVYHGIDRTFVAAECDHFVTGLLWSLDCLWINSPLYEPAASRKVQQLTIARQLGLRIPRTIVTSNPDAASNFLKSLGRGSVFKRVGASPGPFCQTTRLTKDWLPRLRTITSCPTIFQEYIEPIADYRIVWLDGQLWPFEIDATSSSIPEDTRLDPALPCRLTSFDAGLCALLYKLMRALNLLFGVLDLRLGIDGNMYFFEVNPAGQFAYLEDRTGRL